jgi:hypothetical protein
MVKFGFASSLLKISVWNHLRCVLPEKFFYWRGPLKFGQLIGSLPQGKIQGIGWQLPENCNQIWSSAKIYKFWHNLLIDINSHDIRIIGLDDASAFIPPVSLRNQTHFPGVSDGKALELLIFINRFRGILRSYDIAPQKAKAMVIWEEGNLGVTCARLIAREVRFLTLVSPNERSLERAAELIFSETGISSQTFLTLPEDFRGSKIIIKCGNLFKLQLARNSKRLIWYDLFQKRPSLSSINVDLPITASGKYGDLPLYPALGEAILRSHFDLMYGFWHGSELPLERVTKLAACLRELGREIAV